MEHAIAAIRRECTPERIILYAEKRTLTTDQLKSVSFCIIIPECGDKNELMQRLYLAVETDVPVNLTLYTHEEWAALQSDPGSYAAWIGRRGRVIYESTP